MKKIFYFLCLSVIALTFPSCNDDDNDETKKPTSFDEIDEKSCTPSKPRLNRCPTP